MVHISMVVFMGGPQYRPPKTMMLTMGSPEKYFEFGETV